MKLTHSERTEPAAAGKAKKSGSALSSRLAAYAFSGLCALSAPLIERTAHAQPQPPVPETAQPAPQPAASPPAPQPAQQRAPAAQPEAVNYSVAGERAVLSEGQASLDVYMIVRGRNAPILTIEGPARITVRVYPILNRSLFPTGAEEISRSIEYTFGEIGSAQATRVQVQAGLTRRSDRRATCIDAQGARYDSCVDMTTSILGDPITLTQSAPRGRHQLTVTGPNGFFRVVSVERIVTRPPEETVPQVPVTRPQPQSQPQPATAEPRAPASERERRAVVTADGEWLRLRGIGPLVNSGDMIRAQVMGEIPVHENIAILVGAQFSSYRLALETAEAQSDLRSYSGDAALGARLRFGRHSVYGLGLAGYRAMRLHTLSLADARALDTLEHQFEYGGQAGYSYSRYFAASVTGSNSQFNPISARLYGMVPYWFWPGLWNAEMHPWAEVNMLWLHSMRPTDQAGRVGALELGDNNFYLHGYAGLPLLGLGPVVIFGLAGGEFNASREGVHSGTGIFGGGLSAHFLDRLDIEAAGAATLHGDPLVMLRVSYSR